MNKDKNKMVDDVTTIFSERCCEVSHDVCSAYDDYCRTCYALALYDANYRKIGEDEVVLKLSEVDEFRKDQAEVKFLKHKIEREAVEEFAKIVVSVIFEDEENEKIKIRDVHDTIRDILRMHYDIEVGEVE